MLRVSRHYCVRGNCSAAPFLSFLFSCSFLHLHLFPSEATRVWFLFARYWHYLSLVKGQIPQLGVLDNLNRIPNPLSSSASGLSRESYFFFLGSNWWDNRVCAFSVGMQSEIPQPRRWRWFTITTGRGPDSDPRRLRLRETGACESQESLLCVEGPSSAQSQFLLCLA